MAMIWGRVSNERFTGRQIYKVPTRARVSAAGPTSSAPALALEDTPRGRGIFYFKTPRNATHS